jgi:hypothetical protein
VVGLLGVAIIAGFSSLIAVSTGLEHSLTIFGPLTTFMLPVLAMIAL